MEPNQDLGDRVRLLRESKSMTQAELGARIGLSQTSVAQIETGVTIKPRRGTLAKLCRFFAVSEVYLYSGVGQSGEAALGKRLPADPKPATPTAGPLSVVPESEQVKELKAQNEELRKQLEFMRDLMRSGVDFSKLGSVASFLPGSPEPAQQPVALMRIAA